MERLQHIMMLVYSALFVNAEDITTVSDFSSTTISPGMPDCESIGCECWDLVEIIGLSCNNVTDFDLVTRRLGDGSLFQYNETYEITFTGIETFPPRFLRGLIVYKLIIDDPMTNAISTEAFDDVLRLKKIFVASSSIKVIPNLTQVSGLLSELVIENSLLTSVGSELQHQPALVSLALRNNSIRTVNAMAFFGTTRVEILDLSWNRIESLSPDLVTGLRNLTKLVLSYNRLLSVHGLLDVPNLRAAFLSFNNLSDADDILPRHNESNLATLLLTGNPLGSVSETSFNYRFKKGLFLYLDYCSITEFDVKHYTNLNLSILDLTGNHIERIPEGKIGFGTNLHLFLANNRITSFEGSLSYKVRRFYIFGNRLTRLGSMLQLIQPIDVDVSSNQLEVLLWNDLRSSHGIENLGLRHNYIKSIDTETFSSLQNYLRNLDLSVNRFKSLNGSVKFLSRLKSLNVSHNSIDFIQEDEFAGLNELSQLLMQNNRIHVVGGLIQRLSRLSLLNVFNNSISTVTLGQLPKSLQYLYVKENPLSCDCRLLNFLQWMNSTTTFVTFDTTRYCSSNVTTEVSSSEESDTKNYPCPLSCQCSCLTDVNDTFIQMRCHSWNFSRPPDLFSSEADDGDEMKSSIRVVQNAVSSFTLSDRVLTLNLERNNLTSLDLWCFPRDLKELRLANNLIHELPETVLQLPMLKKATLSNNPWSCNCKDVARGKWLLSKREGISDLNRTFCGPIQDQKGLAGKLIIALTDVELCPTTVEFYITIALSLVTVLLLISAMTIAYNRYEFHIKVWLYNHGITWVKEEDLDQDKAYEVFISYSHEDTEFVLKFYERLEQKMPGVRVCLHHRDFVPGALIHDNIVNAIKKSKRTLLILSEHFFTSSWCVLEFRTAYDQQMKEDNIPRIVVINTVKGDLPDEIPSDLKEYLNSTTYLIWGHEKFWERLLYVLPEPGASDKAGERIVEMIETCA